MSEQISIMGTDEPDPTEANYTMDSVVRLFKGRFREWALYFDKFEFTKHFMVKTSPDITHYSKKYGIGLQSPFELHFTLESYSPVKLFPEPAGPRQDWNLVVDIDIESMEERHNALSKITSLLNKCGIYYLVDSRYHIWFPTWESLFIEQWNALYGEDEFSFGLKAYLETICDLPDCIDEGNFRNSRKLFRAPFSLHLKSGKPVTFITPKLDTIQEFEIEWLGKNQPTEVIEDYARRFQRFLRHARTTGHQLHLMKSEELNNTGGKEIFTTGNRFKWIDDLMVVKIPKGKREMILHRVIMPYLVNVRKLSQQETVSTVHQWLDKSAEGDRRRDRDLYRKPVSQFASYASGGYLPTKRERLLYEYPAIFALMTKQ